MSLPLTHPFLLMPDMQLARPEHYSLPFPLGYSPSNEHDVIHAVSYTNGCL